MQRAPLIFIMITLSGAVLLAGCSGTSESRGRDIYIGSGCARCHGQNLEGTNLGPSLGQVRAYWTSDRLASYLEDPSKIIEADPRLQGIRKKYTATMPSYGALDQATRLELARYLMGSEE